MAVFSTREDAEQFARQDPFVVHGVVRGWLVREWNEALTAEAQDGCTPTSAVRPDRLYAQIGCTPRSAVRPDRLYAQIGCTPRSAVRPGRLHD
jgi:hypothetical protein